MEIIQWTLKQLIAMINKIKKLVTGKGRISEIIRFGIVGGVATLLQYGFYVIFVDLVDIPAVAATMVSYALSFVFNFVMSNYFTFHTKPNAKKGIGFTLSHIINMGLQVGFVAIFKDLVGDTLALLPAMMICIPVNYLLVRFALTNRRFKSSKEKAELLKQQQSK